MSSDLLNAVLGGGFVATLGALFGGIKSLKEGSRAQNKATVRELVKQRKSAWTDRDYANDMADYWRNWAGTVEFEARRNGVKLPERPPEPAAPAPEEDEKDE